MENTLTSNEYVEFVKNKKKFSPINNLMKSIQILQLDSYENDDERLSVFLKYMLVKKLKWSTVRLYCKKLKPLFWPNSTLAPSKRAFISPPQNKTPNTENLKLLILHLKKNMHDRYTHPIIFAYYTGLRVHELVNLKISHLQMLMGKANVLPLKRKNDIEWTVYYMDKFNEFISDLGLFYARDLEAYKKYNVNQSLFHQNASTINSKLKKYYIHTCKELPPAGFGIHVFRYNIATIIENKEISRRVLGHKNIKITEKYYIKINGPKLQKELDKIAIESQFYSSLIE